jgi:hypothetical protein
MHPALPLLAALLPASANELTHDFRRGLDNQPALHLVGPHPASVVRQEPQGLRLTLPADRASRDPVGIAPRFRIRGDFEITAGYEILAAEEPRSGHGVGFNLWVRFDEPRLQAASVGQLRRAGKGYLLVCDRTTTDDEGQQQHRGTTAPAESRQGWVRLTRIGSRLTWFAAGPSGQFTKLYESDVSPADVTLARLAATSGFAPHAVDVRLLDVAIRSDVLPNTSSAPEPPPSRGWWWALVAPGLAMPALGGWLLLRRRQRCQGTRTFTRLGDTNRYEPDR